MRFLLQTALLGLVSVIWSETNLISQPIRVSENQRFLVQTDGSPFFWLADTAWELFHRCSREDATLYLKKRKSQGFNVIQAVVLAELDGLHVPNPYGELPLINDDPAKPNPAYFEHVDFILAEAARLDLYIALLPTWGDKVFTNSWGKGPEIFNAENAKIYGKWLGERYRDRENIIWIIGGDRTPRENSQDVEIWRNLAEGVAEGCGGHENALMSFHPQPHDFGGSSHWFHENVWLDFNMHQTGHCPKPTYLNIRHDYQLSPVKPVLDGEPLYEDHPLCFNADERGYSLPRDIRRIMYWNVFAGAAGQTYGCHDIWQMHLKGENGINGPLRPWQVALDLPMAHQVHHLKDLVLSRPFLSRIPDQSMIETTQEDGSEYVIATRDQEGRYAMIYFPTGKSVEVNLDGLIGTKFSTWWFDPRTGTSFKGEILKSKHAASVTPPSNGTGQDWVLVIDTWKAGFPKPGQSLY